MVANPIAIGIEIAHTFANGFLLVHEGELQVNFNSASLAAIANTLAIVQALWTSSI
ncbi:hypothetical protein [Polynucleobacter sp. MWH-UH23A]|uniref:hypothetical protein n=1 Tax=Polynucleobacter sp. MWH-UH23A TaxID=1855613 RepID=UPI0033650135